MLLDMTSWTCLHSGRRRYLPHPLRGATLHVLTLFLFSIVLRLPPELGEVLLLDKLNMPVCKQNVSTFSAMIIRREQLGPTHLIPPWRSFKHQHHVPGHIPIQPYSILIQHIGCKIPAFFFLHAWAPKLTPAGNPDFTNQVTPSLSPWQVPQSIRPFIRRPQCIVHVNIRIIEL